MTTKRRKTRWIEVPETPTREMLEGMANATFLQDRSDLEMARRFNGLIGNLPKRRHKKESKVAAICRIARSLNKDELDELIEHDGFGAVLKRLNTYILPGL